MNTNDEKIQWHPAFDAALQIEFGDEAKYLEFDPEHLISKKPMQIDVLVKNEKHVKLRKNIGRIFRQYNIIEYKSSEDDLDIDDFYKTYAYACLYKSDTETVDMIPADELTITFVCYHYPRNMLRKLEQDRKMAVQQQDSGIYYLIGDAIPIQLVIVPKLSKEHNYWLNNLRNDLKAGSEIKKITETSYGKSSEKLNWDAIVSKKGETRVEHIKRHMVQNNSRETHSVFNGNPIDMVNDAWEQRHLVEPISDGMGGTIYNIPYKNAGYESGYINTGAQMDYITIVTLDESTDLITAFPSFGDYHK